MKTGIMALSLLTLAGAATSAALLRTRGNLLDQVATLESTVAGVRKELAAANSAQTQLSSRLGTVQAELAETRTRLATTESAASELRRELAQSRVQHEEAEKRAVADQKEIGLLRESLALTKLEVAQAGADEIAAYQATIAQLEEQLAALTTEDTPAPADEPEFILPASVPVLSVGPANAFVVLGFGANEGARPDHTLEIRRGTETLATVLITSVHPQHAIAQVRPDTLQAGLHKGDLATITSSP